MLKFGQRQFQTHCSFWFSTSDQEQAKANIHSETSGMQLKSITVRPNTMKFESLNTYMLYKGNRVWTHASRGPTVRITILNHFATSDWKGRLAKFYMTGLCLLIQKFSVNNTESIIMGKGSALPDLKVFNYKTSSSNKKKK